VKLVECWIDVANGLKMIVVVVVVVVVGVWYIWVVVLS
jgi:hypothetical protein